MATLHAVIIGINGYKQCRPLEGCINDALAVSEYFQQLCAIQNGMKWNPTYLLHPGSDWDKDLLTQGHYAFKSPTRQNIIEAFQHFDQAKDGDFCLFYYSGHGSTVKAPEKFLGYEPGDVLQTIVCADSRIDGKPDLLDKEIGYLIAKALKGKEPDPENPEKGVHFLAIFDSCHSGTVTRGDDDNNLVARMAESGPMPKEQDIEGFTMSGNCYYDPFKTNQKAVEPGGIRHSRHISLSAARNTESAIETYFPGKTAGQRERRGVFSWSLLETLRQNGTKLTYAELIRRVELSVRTRVDNQIPVLGKTDVKDDNLLFFRNQVNPVPQETVFAAFNEKTSQWILNAGATNGIPVPTPGQDVFVKLGDRHIKVLTVEPGLCVLDAASFTEDDKKQQTHAITLDPTYFPKIKVEVSAMLSAAQKQALETAFNDSPPAYAQLVGPGEMAQYIVKTLPDVKTGESCFILTRPGSTIPLYMRTPRAHQFVADLAKICRYEHVLNLHNPASAIPNDAVSVQIGTLEGKYFDEETFRAISKDDTQFQPVAMQSDTIPYPEIVRVSGKLVQGDIRHPAIKVRLKVRPGSRYWVGGLYCDEKFGISGTYLPPTQIGFDMETDYLDVDFMQGAYRALPLTIDEAWFNLGVTEIQDYLILFVSTQKFDFSPYEQDGVELDTMRAIGFQNNKTLNKPDWKIIKIPIHISIPKAKQPLVAGKTQDFGAFKIKAPANFNGACEAVTRSNVLADKSADGWSAALPPHNLWDGVEGSPEVFARGVSTLPDAHLNILEISVDSGTIDMNNPLTLTPSDPLADDEAIVPYGWNEDLGLWMPVGFTDEAGNIQVVQLPSKTKEHIGVLEDGQKSVSSSIKLFFQKLVWSKITGRKRFNSLSLVTLTDGKPERSAVYYGSQSEKDQQALAAIQAAVKGGEVLLLTHGIIGDTEFSAPVLRQHAAIAGKFKAMLTFDYENLDTEIEKTAQTLHQMLLDCAVAPKSVTVVAHSMGGLVNRWMIEKVPGAADLVKKLIQIGTPNTGSEVGDFRKKLTGWIALGLNGVTVLKPYLSFCSLLWKGLEKRLFRTLNQMEPDSEFMDKLNGADANRNGVPYYLITGNTELIESSADEDDTVLRQLLIGLKERSKYILADYLFFDGDANDLAVRVDRALAVKDGFQDHAVLPCDHVSYFRNKQVMGKLEEYV